MGGYGTKYTLNKVTKGATAYPAIFPQEEYGVINGQAGGTLKRSQVPSTGYIVQDKALVADKSITVTSTYLSFRIDSGNFGNYMELFRSTSQSSVNWVASRSTMWGTSYADFLVYATSLNNVYCSKLYTSKGASTAHKKGLRPIVTLDPNTVSIGSTGSGTADDPFSITKK